MAQLNIDLSGRGGLAHKFFGDVNDVTPRPQLRYIAKDTQMVGGTYNPIRNYGFLSPATAALTTVAESDGSLNFTDQWRASVYDSGSGSFYFGENGPYIWGGDFSSSGSTTATNLRNTLTAAIAGSNVKVTDFEIYQKNGVKQIFWSYQKTSGGGGDIGLFAPASDGNMSSNINTWLSGTATGGFNTGATNDVFMRTADNGFMYIFDGNYVHKVDGTTTGGANGTVTANVLVFPFTLQIPDAIDWKGALFIAVQSSAGLGIGRSYAANEQTVGVYVWDRQTTTLGSEDFIPLNGVREICKLYTTPTGELRALVVSSDRFLQVRRYNGNTFVVLDEAPMTALPNYRDSFTFMGPLATWYGNDAKIYCHGAISVGEPEGLYTLGDTTGTVNGSFTTGAVLYADDNFSTTTPRQALFLSAKDSIPTVFNKIWYPHGTGTISSTSQLGSAGSVYSPVKFLAKLSTVNFINVFCIPTATSSATVCGTIKVYFNQSTTAFKSYDVPLSDAARGYVVIPIRKPYVNSIQIQVSWPTNIALGTNDFCPAFAVVDYDTSTTVK